MQALLRAYAKAWSQAGAADLAALVSALDASQQSLSQKDQVPAGLKSDFDRSIACLALFPDLQRQLTLLGSHLPWMQGNMKMPESFQGRFAYVELAGPRGMIEHNEISFGLYLQQPSIIYPSHWHAAVEDYLVVSGTAMWQVDNAEYVARIPGSHFKHESYQPHATTTRQDPLLAMWFWRGDIRDSTYRIVGVDA